jgi:GDP-4-dehydro-6-deoxy-D-mannose reductase
VTVLVTGANGFVGRWVVRALLAAGHTVVAAAGPDAAARRDDAERRAARWVALDLLNAESVRAVAGGAYDAVVHLAGLASGGEALRDPALAWTVNAGGTARLLDAFGQRRRTGDADPLVLLASTAEVYRPQMRPLVESDAIGPRSPYAASKRGAELAADETAARTALRVVTTRAFPHTGPGQDERFVVPAFARRLLDARRSGAKTVAVGNLEVTRDLLDVRDVAGAYVELLRKGVPGEVYNVASGSGVTLHDVFDRLARQIGVKAAPVSDPTLLRPADVPYLVGDAAKLRAATGWAPTISLDHTIRDLVDAQAH